MHLHLAVVAQCACVLTMSHRMLSSLILEVHPRISSQMLPSCDNATTTPLFAAHPFRQYNTCGCLFALFITWSLPKPEHDTTLPKPWLKFDMTLSFRGRARP